MNLGHEMEDLLALISLNVFEQVCLRVSAGDEAFRLGNYLEAYMQYDQALQQTMEKLTVILWYKRSEALEKQGRYEERDMDYWVLPKLVSRLSPVQQGIQSPI